MIDKQVFVIREKDMAFCYCFISIYNEKNSLIPPEGYLFDGNFIIIDNYSDEEEPEFCDIDPEFVFDDGLEELTDRLEKVCSLPIFEKFIDNSTGTNSKDSGFPYSIAESVV